MATRLQAAAPDSPTPTSSQRARPLSVQVALKGTQHTEGEGSIQFVAEEDKSLNV